jgi:CspA family cold shock protein
MLFTMNERISGSVKWFSNERGYGFVTVDGDASAKEYFVHYSYVKMNGYKTLRAGQKVDFILTDTDRGVQAQDVEILAA